MEENALKALDKIPADTNIYQLITVLVEKCRQVNRVKLGAHRIHPINRILEDIAGESAGDPKPPPVEKG